MVRNYSLKLFFILLSTVIFFAFSLFSVPKAFAQVCSFQGYSPPVTPNAAFCTKYFRDIRPYPPCNSESVCSNKVYKVIGNDCLEAGGGSDGTTCCRALDPNYFCDQRDLGSGSTITQYDFRCCRFPPPPTPTPTPSIYLLLLK